IDINPKVLNTNYPAKVAIQGDANEVLPALLRKLKAKIHENNICFDARYKEVSQLISEQKASYKQEWYKHDSGSRVNPALFFDALRKRLPDDGYVVVDDGNHTFLTAELMPIHTARTMISPTDFNCMGYAVPATIGTKLLNPEKDVVSIIGDGAFLMTCMEITTASKNGLGAIFTIFNDGELSQISQAQEVPYNRKTCSVLADTRMQGVAMATGAAYVRIDENSDIDEMLDEAWRISKAGQPVVLDVNIDYSKQTRFTKGIVGTNLKRLPLNMKVRMISRALVRKVTC
ncbi:thiamine pyrophosphate-dependent enzyme, partial [Oleiphilus sp. HI0061]